MSQTNQILQTIEVTQALSILKWMFAFIMVILGIVGSIGGAILKIKKEIESKTQRAEDKIAFHADKQEKIVSKYAENTNNAIIQITERIQDNALAINDALRATEQLEKRIVRIESWKDKITDESIKR